MTPEVLFVVDVAKVLIGTFVGAVLAFAANIYAQRVIRRRQERQAGNVAAMILAMQWHDFVNFRLGFLDGLAEPKREFGEIPHWVLARPVAYTFSEALKQDVSKLVFLGDAGDAETVQSVVVAERRYLDLVDRAKQFNEAAKEKQARYQEVWRRRPVNLPDLLRDTADSKAALRALEHEMGLELVGRLDAIIDGLIDRFATDDEDYAGANKALYDTMRATFRKKIFKLQRLEIGLGDDKRAQGYKADRYRPMSVQLELADIGIRARGT